MDTELRDRACDKAYRDHAADVYRVAYGILRNPDEALDATHEAFARAWERWEQYDSQRPLRPWLHGIVVHIALDALRRRRVRQLAASAVVSNEPPGYGQADPAGEIVQRRVVEQALAELRPESRAALVLRHYYGYDYAQIGEFLRMPSGSVGSILSRAHATLRERLAESGPPPVSSGANPAANPAATSQVTPTIRATRAPATNPPEALP